MKTFGEFFDAVQAAVRVESIGCAGVHMSEWSQIDSGVSWEDARAMELSEGLFAAFAEDMQTMWADLMSGTCTENAYAGRLEDGHKFMRVIARLGREFGLSDEVCGSIDVPLSPGEALRLAAVQRKQ